MIYEFITPSDPITFKAETDAVAYAISVYLGNGKGGCTSEDGRHLDTMLMFADAENIKKSVKDNLGTDTINEFIEQHPNECAAAFESFAYGSIADRKTFDAACEAITDKDKLEKFKNVHEETQRTSMSEWVKYAWKVGRIIREKTEKGIKLYE